MGKGQNGIGRHHNPIECYSNVIHVDKGDRRGLPAPHVASSGGEKDEDQLGTRDAS